MSDRRGRPMSDRRECPREKLRKLAEAATPGPWWADTGATIGDDSDEATHVWYRAARNDLYLAIGKVLDNDLDQTTFEDAEFIAAANPTAVLGLLDQLDAAEAKLAKANRSLIELKPDPVLVEDSWIPANELATVCGNFMRSSREFASQIKAAEAKLARANQLLAQAWDEGHDEGWLDHIARVEVSSELTDTPNPYRKAKQ